MQHQDGNNEDGKNLATSTMEALLKERGIPNRILRAVEGTEISVRIEKGELNLTFKTSVVMLLLVTFVSLARWDTVTTFLHYISHILPQ